MGEVTDVFGINAFDHLYFPYRLPRSGHRNKELLMRANWSYKIWFSFGLRRSIHVGSSTYISSDFDQLKFPV